MTKLEFIREYAEREVASGREAKLSSECYHIAWELVAAEPKRHIGQLNEAIRWLQKAGEPLTKQNLTRMYETVLNVERWRD